MNYLGIKWNRKSSTWSLLWCCCHYSFWIWSVPQTLPFQQPPVFVVRNNCTYNSLLPVFLCSCFRQFRGNYCPYQPCRPYFNFHSTTIFGKHPSLFPCWPLAISSVRLAVGVRLSWFTQIIEVDYTRDTQTNVVGEMCWVDRYVWEEALRQFVALSYSKVSGRPKSSFSKSGPLDSKAGNQCIKISSLFLIYTWILLICKWKSLFLPILVGTNEGRKLVKRHPESVRSSQISKEILTKEWHHYMYSWKLDIITDNSRFFIHCLTLMSLCRRLVETIDDSRNAFSVLESD